MEDVPLAIAPFQGRVLVGVGKLLRIYDMGKKKLLRKCENKVSVRPGSSPQNLRSRSSRNGHNQSSEPSVRWLWTRPF